MKITRSKILLAAACLIPAAAMCFLPGCRRDAQAPENASSGLIQSSSGSLNWRAPVKDTETPAAFLSLLRPQTQGLASWTALEPQLKESLRLLSRRQEKGRGAAAGIEPERLRRTLVRLLELLPELDSNPSLLLREFEWRRLKPAHWSAFAGGRAIKAAREPSGRRTQAVYAEPAGGWKNGAPTRQEIDAKGILKGQGLELAWLDPVDARYLQKDGEARIVFPDGEERMLIRTGTNGKAWKPLDQTFRERSIKLKEYSRAEMRAWLAAHPRMAKTMLMENPAYAFFRIAPSGEFGSYGARLSPWTSVKADPAFAPLGAVLACGADMSFPGGSAPMRFIGLAHAADKSMGKGRLAIFAGRGATADWIAKEPDMKGAAWILLVKEPATR